MGYKTKHGSDILNFLPKMQTNMVQGWWLLYTCLPCSLSLLFWWSAWFPTWIKTGV